MGSHIKLLVDQEMSVRQIQDYLLKNRTEFFTLIEKSSCRKWSKWVKDNSIHVFPCVCPEREVDCIFIETYFELTKVLEVLEKEERCIHELKIYQEIKHNTPAVFEWIIANESFFYEINTFKAELDIKSVNNESITIKLNPVEFESILELKEVYYEHYCTEEFENY